MNEKKKIHTMQMVNGDKPWIIIIKLLKGGQKGVYVLYRSQIVDRGDDLLLEVMDSSEAPNIS